MANTCRQNIRTGLMERACKEQIRAHQGLLDVGFVDVDFVAGYVCGNMHNAQGKACARGLYADHPVYCCVVHVDSRSSKSTAWPSGV